METQSTSTSEQDIATSPPSINVGTLRHQTEAQLRSGLSWQQREQPEEMQGFIIEVQLQLPVEQAVLRERF